MSALAERRSVILAFAPGSVYRVASRTPAAASSATLSRSAFRASIQRASRVCWTGERNPHAAPPLVMTQRLTHDRLPWLADRVYFSSISYCHHNHFNTPVYSVLRLDYFLRVSRAAPSLFLIL